jgi:hypothetical protein
MYTRIVGCRRNSELSRRLLENIHISCLLGSFSGRDIKASSKQRGAVGGVIDTDDAVYSRA